MLATINGILGIRSEFSVERGDPMTYAENMRIVGLPVMRRMTVEELEEYNRTHVLAHAFDDGFRLFPDQAEAVDAYENFDGLFGTLKVGSGKTLTLLMCAAVAYAKGIERILLTMPPQVYPQLINIDIPWARNRVNINYPIHLLGGKTAAYRKALCESGRKGVYIMPHSYLSIKDTSALLEAMNPQVILIDEAHKLANPSSACTRRVMSFVNKHKPQIVAVSGTITAKSPKDYYHIIKAAIPKTCPLPLSDHMANEWAVLIDTNASAPDATPPMAASAIIMPLVVWARHHFPETPGGFPQDVYGFRRAYKTRLNSTPGVVSSGNETLGTSLIIHNNPVPDYQSAVGYEKLKALMDQVTEKWLTPNGDEIEHAIHTWKWLNELSAGFYNELVWPTPEALAKRRSYPLEHATEVLDRAQVHHAAQQQYHRDLRHWLESHARAGLDTPFLVGTDMARNGDTHVGPHLFQSWSEWKALDFDGRPERDSHAVRVCDFKVHAALCWAQGIRAQRPDAGAIIWYHHQEIGRWLAELLGAAGLDCLHCPAGADELVTDPRNGKRILICSIQAHGFGKNLQHFDQQYVVQWPRHPSTAEQMIGRTHRSGQKADELVVNTSITHFFEQLNFAACLNDALYVHQSTGNAQKVIYATYEPLPVIFPPAIMVQRGLDIKRLDSRQQSAFAERFSPSKE